LNKFYKTVIISDVHLGTKDSKTKELVSFLKSIKCENIILNGDIIDAWQLKKNGKWKKKHTVFFKYIMKVLEKENINVIYIRGNHDDFLDEIMPFSFGNFSIVKDYIYESFGKRYYVCHGDVFDSITKNLKWLAKLGDIGYSLLLWINRYYNVYRKKRNLPYYSLSQTIKLKVKKAVSFISDYEDQLCKVASMKNCEGIICGHIHQPANKIINNTHYLNSGDWVESLTALVENYDGKWDVIYYDVWSIGADKISNVEEFDLEELINYNFSEQVLI